MPAITLVAGDASGIVQGYGRTGGSFGAFGSITGEPITGQTVDTFYTSTGFSDVLMLVGNQSPTLLSTISVNGNAWAVGTGTYDAGTNTTQYPVTPTSARFVPGNSYTVDGGGGGADATPPTITSSDAPSVAENATLAQALTANEAVTWSIVGGADQAKFELSGSTLRWASNGTKDYDAPDDADANNTYLVTVRATDAAANTTDQSITVTVTEAFEGPTWVGKSTALGSTAAGNIDFTSSGRAAGDQLFIAIASANQAITAPGGFTEVANSPQFRGTAAAIGGIRLALFQKTGDGTETTVSIADPGDHVYAVGFVIRPKAGESIAVDVSAGKNAAAGTAHSGNALTTTVDNCLIVDVWGTDRDSAGPSYSAQANAGLDALTEQHDAGTTSGVGSGIVVYSGGKIAAGSVAATTATSAASVAWCAITLALKSVGGSGGVVATATGVLGLTGSGAGAVAVRGTSAGVLSLAGGAAGVAANTGAGAGLLALTSTAAGIVAVLGGGTATLPLTSGAAGTAAVRGAAGAVFSLGGAGSGVARVSATAAATLGLSGASSGAVAVSGVASATLTLASSAAGLATGAIAGTAWATLGLTSGSAGLVLVAGAGTGVLALGAEATAQVAVAGEGAGLLALTIGAGGTVVPGLPEAVITTPVLAPARSFVCAAHGRTYQTTAERRRHTVSAPRRQTTVVAPARANTVMVTSR